MHPELTNLLPEKAKRSLRRSYFLRLASVALGLASALLMIHGVLLFPAYLYARGETGREAAQLAQLSQNASTSEEHDVDARTASVSTDVTYLSRLGTLPMGSGVIKSVLSVPHAGIELSGFTFTAAENATTTARMTVSGTASTRDTLRSYVSSLGQLPFVSNADLPISAYAKDSDIPFIITLTGTLRP